MIDTIRTAMALQPYEEPTRIERPAAAGRASPLSKAFGPLFASQFLGAFNDNLLKNILVFLVVFGVASQGSSAIVALSGAVFILPFVLLSALGGQIADRFDKAVVARRVKDVELVAAVGAAAALYLGSVPLLLVALFAFGITSALFGPVKYGILPDLVAKDQLPVANAWVEGATFAAILLGTIVAGLLHAAGIGSTAGAALLVTVAGAGWFATRRIPLTGRSDETSLIERNVVRSTLRSLLEIRLDRALWALASTNAWFWAVGAVVISLLPNIVREGLAGSPTDATVVLGAFSIAVALGSAVAAWLSKGRTPLLQVPIAVVAVALFCADLAWLSLSGSLSPSADGSVFSSVIGLRVLLDLSAIAFFGANVVVPTFSTLQARAPENRRARTVAAANVLSSAAMALASCAAAVVLSFGFGEGVVLAALALASLPAAWLMLRRLPMSVLPDAAFLIYRILFRMDVRGVEHMDPRNGPVVIAANHVSLLDVGVLVAISPETPTFAINTQIAESAFVKPFLRLARALPLDPTKPLSTRTLVRTVAEGRTVGIFPEGRITTTGGLMKVYDGAAMVADKAGVPLTLVRIDGLERTPFSRMPHGAVRKTLFPKVSVTIDEPVRLTVARNLIGRRRRAAAAAVLEERMTDAACRASDIERTIPQALLDAGRSFGSKTVCIEDVVAGRMSYGRMAVASSVLSRKLEAILGGRAQHVGLMLPTSAACVVSFLALSRAGRIPAMVNFTAGASNVASGLRACNADTIVTARAFVEKARLEGLVEELERTFRIVWLEDVRATIGIVDKLLGMLTANRVASRATAHDPAVVLFTSGSEGSPKGVVLSHRNVLANAAQAAAMVDFGRNDKVLNVLPTFHSFGLTAGTFLPLLRGVPVVLYPSPLHYRIIPELAYGSNATIMFGTDTFLNGYARSANAYDFRSIRFVFAGAEPVRDATRRLWAEKFGVRVLEGYGVTETAPVLALNTPRASKAGTVGRLVPGLLHKLDKVDGVERGGRLSVSGDNVMVGYLRDTAPGVIEPPVDGWHDTGDIVEIDAESFVRIVGRAKRFAKIGGEMVSLAAVEAFASEYRPGTPCVAVRRKDERKGESIVLIIDAPDVDRATFGAFLRERRAADIMTPTSVLSGSVPLLGSGKVDFAAAERLYADR